MSSSNSKTTSTPSMNSPSRSMSAATRHHASSISWPLSKRDDGCGARAVWTNASRRSFLPTPGMLDRTGQGFSSFILMSVSNERLTNGSLPATLRKMTTPIA